MNMKSVTLALTCPALLLVACNAFQSSSSDSGTNNSSSSTPGAPPAATPPTSPTPFPVVGDVPIIPSNFDVNAYISGVKDQPVAGVCSPDKTGSAAPDVVGAFRFLCNASHNLFDDPIVYPGQSGASHLHTFFGNTKANANSTYDSLRTTGDSTCSGGPINRSAYWIPSMFDGYGKVVMPDYVTIYYKRRPSTDPECKRQGKDCVALPRGLRMVFGYNMAKLPTDPTQMKAKWMCENGFAAGGTVEHSTIGAAACPTNEKVGSGFSTPDCWDGVNLDSADHRSHLSYGSYGSWGYYKCPTTHPHVIPQFTMKAWYTHQGPQDLANWYLSSDRMQGMPVLANGSSFHSDWFGAWDDDIMTEWHDYAIERLLNCSDGNMGSGRSLNRPATFSWLANPRLVDPPAMTTMQKATQEAAMIEMHSSAKGRSPH